MLWGWLWEWRLLKVVVVEMVVQAYVGPFQRCGPDDYGDGRPKVGVVEVEVMMAMVMVVVIW